MNNQSIVPILLVVVSVILGWVVRMVTARNGAERKVVLSTGLMKLLLYVLMLILFCVAIGAIGWLVVSFMDGNMLGIGLSFAATLVSIIAVTKLMELLFSK